MKKLIALLLVAVMAIGLFAACGKTPVETTPKDTTPKDTTPSTTAPKDTTPSTTAPKELETDWIWEDTSLSGELTFAIPFKTTQGMQAMVDEFNKTYPNIKVNIHTYSNTSDGQTQMRAAVVAGTIDVWAAFGLSSLNKMVEGELGMDLTDLCEEEGIDLKANWGTDAYVFDDTIYSFPCGGMSVYVAINMDAWKEAGLDKKYEATGGLPTEWTWEEYIEASELMTKTNADGTTRFGGSDYHSINYFMYAHCQVAGGDMYYEADGTSSYDNPIIKAALERKIKAELEDKIWYPDAKYRGESIQAQTPYCEGITASTIIPNVVRFLHDTEKFNVNWITGFAPFPVVEKGQTNYMSGTPNFSHAGISSYLPEEKFDIAWAWLKWYSTHGVKYLAVAGHQPAWKGTEPGSAVELIYGTKEEAAKWIDIESYNRVVGRSDLPGYVETNLTAYGDVSKALNDPMMQCINGEMTPEACLQQALADAEKALADAE
jgi:multiple sugar transport system substrate-binding protein